ERCRIDPCSSPTINLDPEEGRQLKQFLQGFSPSGGKRATDAPVATKPIAAPVAAETVFEEDPATDTDPASNIMLPFALAAAPKTESKPKPVPGAHAAVRQPRGMPTVVMVVVAFIVVGAIMAGI